MEHAKEPSQAPENQGQCRRAQMMFHFQHDCTTARQQGKLAFQVDIIVVSSLKQGLPQGDLHCFLRTILVIVKCYVNAANTLE